MQPQTWLPHPACMVPLSPPPSHAHLQHDRHAPAVAEHARQPAQAAQVAGQLPGARPVQRPRRRHGGRRRAGRVAPPIRRGAAPCAGRHGACLPDRQGVLCPSNPYTRICTHHRAAMPTDSSPDTWNNHRMQAISSSGDVRVQRLAWQQQQQQETPQRPSWDFATPSPEAMPLPPPATAPATAPPAAVPGSEDFMPAAQFEGAHAGYVFGTRGSRTGYYRDTPAQPVTGW